jgi:hypothetical protein
MAPWCGDGDDGVKKIRAETSIPESGVVHKRH